MAVPRRDWPEPGEPGRIDTTYAAPVVHAGEFLTARLIFGGYFLFNGVNHFVNLGAMTAYAGASGVPMPQLAVIASGLLLLAGGTSLLFGIRPRLGAAAIILFLIVVTPMMHAFWREADPQVAQTQQAHFLKNLALIGGALFAAAIPAPWRTTGASGTPGTSGASGTRAT